MRTFTSRAKSFETGRLRALVLAVGSERGVADAGTLLDGLPDLPFPVLVWAEPAAADALAAAGHDLGASPEAGQSLNASPRWRLDPGSTTQVVAERFQISPGGTATGSFGRLCSSLRAVYRSHVLIIATDSTYTADIFVRLLVQRGGGLVETTDQPGEGALAAPVSVLLAHFDENSTSASPAGGLVA